MTVSERQHAAPVMTGEDMELVTHVQTSTGGVETEVAECQPLQAACTDPAVLEVKLEPDSEKQTPSFFVRMRTDATFRHNLIHTALLCLSFVGYGWDLAILGPALPDLQLLTGEDLSTQSWIFTLGSVGYLTGSFLGGFLYDRICKTLLLTVASGMLALTLLVLPFCRVFEIMLAVRVLIGLSEALIDTGCNAHIAHIWGLEVGPYMQAMHFAFSVGALASPLATAPFLAEKTIICSASANNLTLLEGHDVYSSSVYDVRSLKNVSTSLPTYWDSVHDVNSTMEPHEQCSEVYGEIRVHYAFVIASIMSMIPAVGFAILTFTSDSNLIAQKAVEESSPDAPENRLLKPKFTKKVLALLLTLVIIHSSFHCVIDDSFGRFFMTFFLEHLNWTKTKSAMAVFIFWLLYGLGNFVAIFLMSCCDRNAFLRTFVSMFGISFIMFFLSSKFTNEPLIWVSVGMMGFFMSVIFPGVMTWTSDNVTHMTGKVSGLFMVTASLAGFPFPPIIGSAIENLGPMWYVYILAAVLSLCLVTFLAAHILMRVANAKWRLPDSEEEEIELDIRTSVNVV